MGSEGLACLVARHDHRAQQANGLYPVLNRACAPPFFHKEDDYEAIEGILADGLSCYAVRNALRTDLVDRAEAWRWGSLWRWLQSAEPAPPLLSAWPIPRMPHGVEKVNQPLTRSALAAVRRSVRRGNPFGESSWIEATARRLGLASTLRLRGRP